MPTKIQRWGNSQGVRVPKSVLAEARLQVGDVPRKGDIMTLAFRPEAGHEQHDRRHT